MGAAAGLGGGALWAAVLKRTPEAWLREGEEEPAEERDREGAEEITPEAEGPGLGTEKAGLKAGEARPEGPPLYPDRRAFPAAAALLAICGAVLWWQLAGGGFGLLLWLPLMVVCLLLLLIAQADRKRSIIPDQYTAALALLALAFAGGDLRQTAAGSPGAAVFHSAWWSAPAGGLLCGGLALLVALAAALLCGTQGLGFGDVKLFAALGLLLGPTAGLLLLCLSFLLAGLLSAPLLLLRKLRLHDSRPFAPCIAASALFLLCFALPFSVPG
ncbi:MAG: prepilin peptidase [Bacillota bacterium]|nr:prepilin peptidase [Bacillota bacterium]